MTKIERRFVMDIHIQADTEEDLEEALKVVSKALVKEKVRDTISGGKSFGYHIYTRENPEMTQQKYYEALKKDQDEFKEIIAAPRPKKVAGGDAVGSR